MRIWMAVQFWLKHTRDVFSLYIRSSFERQEMLALSNQTILNIKSVIFNHLVSNECAEITENEISTIKIIFIVDINY